MEISRHDPGAGVFDAARFGAVGDGRTLCTRALQRTIDACASERGSLVHLPPGRYLSGALFLRNNVHLRLSAGATLLASQRFEHFPPIASRHEGIERKVHASLLNGADLDNVTVSGRGTIDGQGPPWWEAHNKTRDLRLRRGLAREAENPPDAPLRWPRPRVINLVRCRGVVLSDLVVRDAPFYNLHLVYCEDVVIAGMTLIGLQAQHCDGIVLDSCKQVRVANCLVASGSESISLKSGYNEDGRRVGLPCEDIVVSNCNLSFSPGSAIAVGSETAGDIRNVLVTNCSISNTRYAVWIRSPRGRGGVVERIRVSASTIDKVAESVLMVSHFFDSVRMDGLFGEGPSPDGNPETDRSLRPRPDHTTPSFRDLEFSGLTVGEARDLAVIEGLPERFISRVKIQDVIARQVKSGLTCARAADVTVANVSLHDLQQPAVAARDVERLEIFRLRCPLTVARAPLIHLDNVSGALIHGCDVAQEAARFVALRGLANHGVTVQGNRVGGDRPDDAPPAVRR
jgi:polygalacturonase